MTPNGTNNYEAEISFSEIDKAIKYMKKNNWKSIELKDVSRGFSE